MTLTLSRSAVEPRTLAAAEWSCWVKQVSARGIGNFTSDNGKGDHYP